MLFLREYNIDVGCNGLMYVDLNSITFNYSSIELETFKFVIFYCKLQQKKQSYYVKPGLCLITTNVHYLYNK